MKKLSYVSLKSNYLSIIKFLTLLGLLLFNYKVLFSQIIFTEGFEYNCTEVCPFTDCSLLFYPTHGSADISFNNVSHTGNKAAHMFISYEKDCPNVRIGEGIAISYPLLNGNSYKIKYYIKVTPHEDNSIKLGTVLAQWVLPSNVIPVQLDCSIQNTYCAATNYYLPTIPSGSQIAHTANFVLNSWQYNEQTFTPSSNFDQLWFRINMEPIVNFENVNHTARIYIDDIELECLSPECSCFVNGCTYLFPESGIIKVKNGNTILDNFDASCYNINGIFDINEDFSIDNSTVNFTAGSKVIVRSGNTLIMNNSHLIGCMSMWKGIELEEGAHIFWADGSIEDAQFGVNCLGNAYIDIGANLTFKNCYVGIYSPSGTKKTINSILVDNTFTFDAFKTFYSGQSPIPMTRPFAGIEMNDAIFYLDQGVNTFFNLQNGIVARRSDIKVSGCNINQIVAQSSTLPTCNTVLSTADGCGIFFSSCRNKAIANSNTISNTRSSIVSYFGSLEARNNTISNTNYGIYCDRTATLNGVDISENQISNFRTFGIRIPNPIKFSEIKIIHNTLSSSSSPSSQSCTGSAINLLNVFAPKKIVIENNSISCITGHDGIRLDNCVNVGVQENTITFLNPLLTLASQDGVEINSCRNISLYHNIITGSGISRALGSSFLQLSSTDISYCCNVIDNHKYGFNFKGGNVPTQLKANDINLHYNGVRIENGSETSRQYYLGNKWNVASQVSYQYQALNLNSSKLNRLNSQFRINSCNAPLWPLNIFPIEACVLSNQDDWFFKGSAVNQSCPPLSACIPNDSLNFSPGGGIQIDDNFGFRGLDLNRDIETAERTDFGTVLEWESKRNLMMKLIAYPEMLGVNSSIDSFYSANSSSNLFILSNIEYQLKQELKNNYSINELYFLHSDSIDVIEVEYTNLLSGLSITANFLDSMTIIYQAQDEYTKLASHYQKQDEISNNSISELNFILDSLNSINQAITPLSILETNEKYINNILINKIFKGNNEYSSQDSGRLFTMANQCPLEGGRSVYIARVIYYEIEAYDFDDDVICSSESESLISNVNNSNIDFGNEISLVPNPSSGLCKLEWNSSSINIREIEIINSMNQIVEIKNFETPTSSKSINLDLRNLKNGLYFLKIINYDGNKSVKKLLITK